MARATTKQDLIMASNGQFEKLWVLIDGMSDDLQNATFADQMATAGKEAHWGQKPPRCTRASVRVAPTLAELDQLQQ